MYHFSLLVGLILFLGLSPIQAQEYRLLVEQISVEEGLSNRFVRSIIQDSRGFMWIGTKIGLNRYDGYDFKVFDAKNSALQSDHIEQLWEDADSNLWIGHGLNNEINKSFEEIDILNIHTFKVQSLQAYLGKTLPVPIKDIYRIYNRADSKDLYLATRNGQIYLYKGHGKFELFYDQQQSVTIQDLWFGERYTWICSSSKLLAIDNNKRVVFEHLINISTKWRGELFAQLDSNRMLLSINNGFNVLKILEWRANENQLIEQDSFMLFGEQKPSYIDMQLEKYSTTGFTHFYSRMDFNLYDEQNRLLYQRNFNDEQNGVRLRAVYVDQQNNIWLGASTKGLIKISTPKKRFDVYLKGISTRAITTYIEPNELIIGTYSGRHLINTKTKEEQYVDTLTDHIITPSAFGNYLWVTHTDVVRKNNTQTLKHIHSYHYKKEDYKKKLQETGINVQSTWALHEDEAGNLWLGLDNGIGFLAFGADSIEIYKAPAAQEKLNSSIVYDFHQHADGLWMATSTGLYLKCKNGSWQHYSRRQESPYQLFADYLFDINEDSQGNFWLATQGGGVQRFNPKTGACRQWTTQQGLSHNVVYATLEDDDGYIWMSSDNGLMRMDSRTYLINTFLPEDGLPHEEFNRKSFYKHPNGRLYFGGLSGIVGFDPKDFLDSTAVPPPLYVTRYQYFDGNKSKLQDATVLLNQDHAIDLSYQDRFLILEWALLDYESNAQKNYAYQIEGLQDEWVYTQDPIIRVDGLRSGEYQLRVKAELSSGNWSPILLELPITVQEPFYRQWCFIIGVIIFLLLIVFVYITLRERSLYQTKLLLEQRVRERTKTIEEQASALRELDEMKTRFFANISHELRTPLTLILGPVEAALNQNQVQNPEKTQSLLNLIRRHGLKLKQLIEQILSLSKLEANQLALEEQPQILGEVLKYLWSNFEAQAELQKVEWSLDQEIPPQLQVWMDADKLEKITNNLLSNALKHTIEGGQVGMSTRWDIATNCLYLNINDTGRGIASEDLPHIFKRFYQSKQGKATGGTGIGLALASELAQLMGGDIQVASIAGTGSTFMLTLPLKVISETGSFIEVVAEEFDLPAPTSEKSATLLIVEDLLDMRLFLSELLGQYYHIKTAENGEAGWDFLKEENHGIDLVVSDVMMPIMDGFELLAKIKEKPQDLQVPVIMLTARTAERDKLKALRIGVDDYLQKPFSNRELLARVKNLLEHYEQRKEWIEIQKSSSPALPEENKEVATGEELEEELPLEVVSDPWTENLEEITKREVGNTQFNMVQLAYDLNLSERQLRRKIKAKTGLTPNQYFRCIKLDVARNSLETRRYQTVAEVAHQVGFSNVHYFSKIYLAQYGKKPIEYLR